MTTTPAGRNTERTRRAILDAAVALVGDRGSGASLADIAAAAGVSKSGLLHHFSSREGLLAAVGEDAATTFRQQVLRHVDLAENRPGKLLRAYVRALCGGSEEAMAAFSSSPAWNALAQDPSFTGVLSADNDRWNRELLADGMDHDRMTVVRRAAEGAAMAYSYGDETRESLQRIGRVLLRLAEAGGIGETIG
ncbi:TetR/AcrR family transcriptional regulator [Rathayibacter sp. AY1A3]|uniref:TetR/AcrR family transcriptional regulator n=1 Tax=Rathayibacter sp. AY1A3 TaxID=2080521 RepID=UPI0015E32A68|nr:TetR family transcriptional regulator [Rathayibacter sp. AY1A3]